MRGRTRRTWSFVTPVTSSGQVTVEFATLLLVMLVLSAYFTYSLIGSFMGVSDVMELIDAKYIANYVANEIAGTVGWLPDWQATVNTVYLPKTIGNDEYYLKIKMEGQPGNPGRIVVMLRLGGRWENQVEVSASVPVLVGSLSGVPGVVMIDPDAYEKSGTLVQVQEWPQNGWWSSTSDKPFKFGLYVIPGG